MLSCDCGYDYESWYYAPDDFIKLASCRRKRCVSCSELIDIGADCLEFDRFRIPRCEYEENRFGDEVPLSYKYMCEKCGEIFLNLTDIGYCIMLGDDMRELLQEYWDMTGFKPDPPQEVG